MKLQFARFGAAAVLAVACWTHPPPSFAQSTAPSAKFEVASIKPIVFADCHGGNPTNSAEVLSVHCYSVANLIERAYGQFANGRLAPPWSIPKVEGVPAAINSVGYDITAKAGAATSREVMNGPMLQNLLEDRFKLKVHRETREGPVYALTVAKGGSKLKSFVDGCVPRDYSSGITPVPPPEGFCVSRSGGVFGVNSKTVEVQGGELKMIAWHLSQYLDRPVIDRTGLTGRFDVHMEFAPDQTGPDNLATGGGLTTPGASGRSIFTAVQEDLGLKLEKSTGPVEVLVVDHVEKPSGN